MAIGNKIIENKNKVDKETLKTYSEIDGIEVIKETLLYKGLEICHDMRIDMKRLSETALVLYGLKNNSTNKLYVDYALNRYYRVSDMLTAGERVIVPVSVYDEVVEAHSYRTKEQE